MPRGTRRPKGSRPQPGKDLELSRPELCRRALTALTALEEGRLVYSADALAFFLNVPVDALTRPEATSFLDSLERVLSLSSGVTEAYLAGLGCSTDTLTWGLKLLDAIASYDSLPVDVVGPLANLMTMLVEISPKQAQEVLQQFAKSAPLLSALDEFLSVWVQRPDLRRAWKTFHDLPPDRRQAMREFCKTILDMPSDTRDLVERWLTARQALIVRSHEELASHGVLSPEVSRKRWPWLWMLIKSGQELPW